MARKKPAEDPAGRASVPASRATQSAEGAAREDARPTKSAKPSALLDTRVIYCGDNLEQHTFIVPFTVREILEEQVAMKLL